MRSGLVPHAPLTNMPSIIFKPPSGGFFVGGGFKSFSDSQCSLDFLSMDLQSLINVSPKLLVSPSVYIFNATSPAQIVNLTNKLKASSAVEWAEAAVILGRVN